MSRAFGASEAEKLRAPKYAHLLGGGLGAMFGAIITSPLEVVKTRLQAQNNKITLQKQFSFGRGTILALRSLTRDEGFFGLYRGLGIHLAAVMPSRGIHFLVYGTVKSYLTNQPRANEMRWFTPVVSSAAAGATVVTLMQPLWLIKTRLQLQTKLAQETMYTGALDVLRNTIKKEGFVGLYRGLGASYLGLSETVLQFTFYELAKNGWTNLKFKDKGVSSEHISINAWETLIISSAAKLTASCLTYPHEVIRTRLREQKKGNKYKGPFQGLYVIAREEGFRGLYGGLGPHLIRVVPNAAILFLTYEFTLAYFAKHTNGGRTS